MDNTQRKIAKKDVVLFWLRRNHRRVEAQTQPSSQETMARNDISYGDRIKIVEADTKRAEASKTELESLTEAINFIEENG